MHYYRMMLNSLNNVVDVLMIISMMIVITICFRSHLKNKNNSLLMLGIIGISYLLIEIYALSIAIMFEKGKQDFITMIIDYLFPVITLLNFIILVLFPIAIFLIAKNNKKNS